MFESFLITFRESLEISLIIGIILSYLKRVGKDKLYNVVYLGVVSGILLSIFSGYLINYHLINKYNFNEAILEGVLMLIAAFLLATMILWLFSQRGNLRKNIERNIKLISNKYASIGLFSLVFLSIFREGVETVIFLSAIFARSNYSNFVLSISSFFGVFTAIFLGYAVFVLGKKIALKYFFLVTNFLLILFAAGLIAYGFHELEEAGVLNPIIANVYDINHILNEKGALGSLLKGLFGYNGNPSLLEIISYYSYLLIFGSVLIYNVVAKKTVK